MMERVFYRRQKKFLAASLLSLFVCASIAFFIPDFVGKTEQAHAIFSCSSVGDVTGSIKGALASVGSGSMDVPVNDQSLISVSTDVRTNTSDIKGNTGAIKDKECWLDAIIKNIAKAIIHEVVTSIIAWINNGFEGSPSFVTNPGEFFTDIADQEIGKMIDGSGLGFLCDQFKLDIQFAFIAQRSRSRTPARCTISSIIKNFKSFTGGDFSQGGWPGWISVSTRWENNSLGSYLNAEEHVAMRVSSRQAQAKMTLDWGKGFRSLLGKDGNIKTPGTLVENQLVDAVGEDVRDLELAREFDDIVVALVNVGVSKLMEQGLSGMK